MFARKILFATVILGSCLWVTNVWAATRSVTVKLENIAARKTSERSGDELYFSISEYPQDKTAKLYRVPTYPLHWLSSELKKISDIVLWKGDLADGKSILLIISLLEQDVDPWNLDDHIGSVQVKLMNNKGTLKTLWGQPRFSDQPKVEQPNGKIPKFILFGDGAEYEAKFKVEG